MSKIETLSDVIGNLINNSFFLINYKKAVGNSDGTFTLSGICDIRYIQPGFTVTINGNDYIIKDYVKVDGDWNIILLLGSNPLPAFPGSFQLYDVLYKHGTPAMEETELKKIPVPTDKVPLVYLMEPYETNLNFSLDSSIESRCNFTICFLTLADIPKWLTEDFYHNSIDPMYRLAQDFLSLLQITELFNNLQQKASPKFYAKFGINIREFGTKKLYFSENLSGVGMEISLEVYSLNECCGDANMQKTFTFSGSEIIIGRA